MTRKYYTCNTMVESNLLFWADLMTQENASKIEAIDWFIENTSESIVIEKKNESER